MSTRKQKPAWYVVTAQHKGGYALTWKTRSADTAEKMRAQVQALRGGELTGEVTVTPPELASSH